MAAEQPTTRIIREASTKVAAGLYVFNRPPLRPTMLLRLPVGSIAPRGWLRNQLQLEASGMAGHLAELSRFLKLDDNGWVDPRARGGWEELPYWLSRDGVAKRSPGGAVGGAFLDERFSQTWRNQRC